VLALHSIPSFLLLYSTWEEVTRGVGFWLFMTVLALLVHLAWIPVPFLFHWSMEYMIVHVTTLGLVSLFIFYFICVVSNYRQRVKARDNDVRSKRRLI
jgi:cbb3-type cytochrome oxidase subunit 3